jgi:hypothetical protein
MLQLYHSCLLMFSVFYFLFILVSIFVFYSYLLFFVCMCCLVVTSFIFCCPMTGTGFFGTCTWMYVCVRQYWNISPLPLYSMLLSLFSSRTRAFTSPDSSGQPSSLLRRIFSIRSQRSVQYYTAKVKVK